MKDGDMKQLDKHVYDPWALITGVSSGIGEEFARQAAANGINVVLPARCEERLKEVAAGLTARYGVQARVVIDLGRDGIPLNLGEALHVELSGAGVDVTVLAPVLVNTGAAARMGTDAVPLPAGPISAEQAIDEALTALQEHQATTVTRADLTAAYEGIKGSVVEAIKARLAASQPAH
jgi:short-subunit dehydrogenase